MFGWEAGRAGDEMGDKMLLLSLGKRRCGGREAGRQGGERDKNYVLKVCKVCNDVVFASL